MLPSSSASSFLSRVSIVISSLLSISVEFPSRERIFFLFLFFFFLLFFVCLLLFLFSFLKNTKILNTFFERTSMFIAFKSLIFKNEEGSGKSAKKHQIKLCSLVKTDPGSSSAGSVRAVCAPRGMRSGRGKVSLRLNSLHLL